MMFYWSELLVMRWISKGRKWNQLYKPTIKWSTVSELKQSSASALWVVTERFEKQRRKPSTLKFSCVRSAWIFGVYFLLLRYLAQIKISCCVRFNILRWDLILKLVKHTVLFLPFSLFIFSFFLFLSNKNTFLFFILFLTYFYSLF